VELSRPLPNPQMILAVGSNKLENRLLWLLTTANRVGRYINPLPTFKIEVGRQKIKI
jgi:hypothetical protein